MVINTILPGAWTLCSDQKICLFTLSVPSSWRRSAQALAQRKCQMGGRGYPSVPVYSLDPILIASFPQIVRAERRAWQIAGLNWILATEQADISDLPGFIKNWLREEFSCLGEEEVEATLVRLNDDLWKWNKKTTTYSINQLYRELEDQDSENRDLCFSAIPDLLAQQLLNQSEISFEGETSDCRLKFYRTIRLQQASELMSWPPVDIPIFNGKAPPTVEKVSFVISLYLQTLPWRQQPVIYHFLGVRRWITNLPKGLPYNGCSIYIGDSHRWIDGRQQPFKFMPIKVSRSSGGLNWPSALEELLTINDTSLPSLDALIENPVWNWERSHTEFSNSGREDVLAAIAYHSSFSNRGVSTNCQSGVSPKDLHSLDRAIMERLPLQRVGEATRLNIRRSKSKADVRSADDLWDRKSSHRKVQMLDPVVARAAILRAFKQQSAFILIVWETPHTRDALIKEIGTRLDTDLTNSDETTYTALNGKIEIKTLHISDLSQRLDISRKESRQRKKQLRSELTQQRIQEIIDYLPASDKLKGAIVEIKPKRSYFPPEADPKLAWRIGAARKGYLNQHITAIAESKKESESGSHPVQSAVLDLFRQFGAMPPVISATDSVSSNLWLTCFHILRRNRRTTASGQTVKVAIIVRVNAATGEAQLTTSSIFETEGWLPYSTGLLRLLDENWNPDFSNDASELSYQERRQAEQRYAAQFVSRCLKSCLQQTVTGDEPPKVLFMASAQNGRELLPWLTNPQLPHRAVPDLLKSHLTDSECDRLWIVRIREHTRNETPVTVAEPKPRSQIKPGSLTRVGGIFKWHEACDTKDCSIFLSFRDIPNSAQHILKVEQSRLDTGSAPSISLKPLEIAIVHSPGTEEEQLAILVHDLRNRWPYFAHDVSLPFPFPFATKTKEYAVSPRDTSQEPDEDEQA